MASILVVDDQKAQRRNLAFYLKSQGHEVDSAESGGEALSKIEGGYFDIVVTDYEMENMNGHELMLTARRIQPSLEFIVMTAHGSINLAVDLVRDGAADFVSTPSEYSTILAGIEKVLRRRQLKAVTEPGHDLRMVCQTQKMKEISDLADKAAASDVTMLIEGEVGSGKELFARIVHQNSNRYRARFMVLECGSSSESELEKTFFGSSDPGNAGLLAECNGGTILVRDIDCIGPKMQIRLLRFLREGIYAQADSAASRKSNVRIIASATRGLKSLVASGAFREDLYYLLNVMPVYMPPLRTRTDDIMPLIKHFLARNNARSGKTIKAIAPEVLTWMTSYDWPGNVRELENIIARACVLAHGETLDESLIFTLPQDRPIEDEQTGSLNITLKDNQRTLILKALKHNSGNFSRTATQLGISRTTLWRRLKKFKIEGLPVDQT
jgi:DNA-binding NtrC family response regulator